MKAVFKVAGGVFGVAALVGAYRIIKKVGMAGP